MEVPGELTANAAPDLAAVFFAAFFRGMMAGWMMPAPSPGCGSRCARSSPGRPASSRCSPWRPRYWPKSATLSRVSRTLSSLTCLALFTRGRCVGFLRYLIQVIGAEAGRPPVMHHGQPLSEGYVEAFGVDPQARRRGIGTALQRHAARQCRIAGCYQMCSRSPVTSSENYALKIAAGYVLHPSHENDSYHFLFRL